MSAAEITSRLVAALDAAADREADAKTALVSVTIDLLAQPGDGAIETTLTRKTRTLVFLSAEFKSGGARIAAASSVHKIVE